MTRQVTLLTLALCAMGVGVLVYVFDRQPEFIYFLPGWLSLNSMTGDLFGGIGNHLPTFIHVYSFILLTVVIAIPSITKLIPVCLTWFTFDSLFEIAQLDLVATWIGNLVPSWFSSIPFLENTSNYFLMGTFDPLDLLSITLGTLAAYLTISYFAKAD